MSRSDPELDRIKLAKAEAADKRNDAWERQEVAWNRRSSARDALSRAWSQKQAAKQRMNDCWEIYQSERDQNQAEYTRNQQLADQAHYDMQRAFENASQAYLSGQHDMAAYYSNEGHRLKTSRDYYNQANKTVNSYSSAKQRFETARGDYQVAKAEFDRYKAEFDSAKLEHEAAQQEFQELKAKVAEYKEAFDVRLEEVRRQRTLRDQKRKQEAAAKWQQDLEILRKAGVPREYHHKNAVMIFRKKGKTTLIYFGGRGAPNGSGHGLYEVGPNGEVINKAEPGEPHSSGNFAKRKGAVLYDRRARRDSEPSRVSSKIPAEKKTNRRTGRDVNDGIFFRKGKGTDLHVTQTYADNMRVSWDANSDGTTSGRHWSNQGGRKKGMNRTSRHTPPSDARQDDFNDEGKYGK